MTQAATHRAIEAVWRIEAASVIAGVARLVRDVGLDGWLRVTDSAVTADRDLTTWVDRGVRFARSLPPKKPKR